MELTSMTVQHGKTLVAFSLAGSDGTQVQYTMKRKPEETLADVAARVEDVLRQLQLGTRKPLNVTF